MIAILQRVARASVTVENERVAECGRGLMILLGVAENDTDEDAILLSEKIAKLRIFTDDDGKMNLSVNDVGGSVITVPNFTLLAAYRKGNRPDFLGGAKPDAAKRLFELFADNIGTLVNGSGRGIFGADMKVEILNDGPVTIPMDSRVLRQTK